MAKVDKKQRVAPVRAAITRRVILKKISSHIEQMEQWASSGHWGYAAAEQARALSLIELLEADDCRSHGGFDIARGQKPPRGGPVHTLLARYNWLLKLKVEK